MANPHETAARALIDARRTGRQLAALPDGSAPATVEDGYAIQEIVALEIAATDGIAGWKVGATARAVMQKFGVDEPFFGAIAASDLVEGPARLPHARYPHGLIECEFAFLIGQDLVAGRGALPIDEVLDAVEAVVPAIEIISSRFTAVPFGNAALAIADCGVNGGLVTGAPITDGWRELDLAAAAVRLSIDGHQVAAGTGADALGDPRLVLHWLANALRRRGPGLGLRKGQIVTTGTCTGVIALPPGQTALADFGDLGRVELQLT